MGDGWGGTSSTGGGGERGGGERVGVVMLAMIIVITAIIVKDIRRRHSATPLTFSTCSSCLYATGTAVLLSLYRRVEEQHMHLQCSVVHHTNPEEIISIKR